MYILKFCLGCRFNLQICKAEDFNIINDRELGYCYRFNNNFNKTVHKNLLTSSRVGKKYGFSIEIFAGLANATYIIN